MNRKLPLTILYFAVCFYKAQIVFFENFTAPFNPAASGWIQQNNSVPLGTGTWFQGNSSVFPAYNGQQNDFFACNYSSQSSSPGGISNFLITPTLNLVNGAVLRFFTRTEAAAQGPFPDRLQLLMSQGSGTGSIGSGTTAVGSFTDVLLDINPNLTTTGYPFVWTGFTGTVTGVTGTVVGRFAFRYFVNDGGPNGTNSDYVGIDSVTYALPCAPSVFSITATNTAICSGGSALLSAATTLTNAPTSYSWSNGQVASSIVVSPSVTTSYILYAQNSIGCLGNQSIVLFVNPNPTVTAFVSDSVICAGTNVVFGAGGANTYVWSGPVASTSAVFSYSTALSGSHNFSVTGSSNAGCINTATVSIYVNSNPSVMAAVSEPFACFFSNVMLSATGADTYLWSGSGTSTSNPYNYNCGNVAGLKQFTVVGTSAVSSCSAQATVSLTVYGTCAGIDESSSQGALILAFPNPFNDELQLFATEGSIIVTDLLGQILISVQVNESAAINTASWPKGVYLSKMSNKEGTIIRMEKLIKN